MLSYQLGWEGMSSYFCLDIAVRAGDFDLTSVYDEVTGETTQLHEDDKVFPTLAVLPMGFSRSLLFCHSLLTEAMLEASARVGGGTKTIIAADFCEIVDRRRCCRSRLPSCLRMWTIAISFAEGEFRQ